MPTRIARMLAAAIAVAIAGSAAAQPYPNKPVKLINPWTPAGPAELLARIESLARRVAPQSADTVYRVGDLELDRLSHTVTRAGKEIPLQPREFRLLEYLMRHAGHVVTRTMLLENVWDYHFDPQTNVIDVHVSRLRSKIDKGHDKQLLHTVRGTGYMVRESAK